MRTQAVVVGALVTLGISSRVALPQGPTRRDSGGIHIIESTAPAWRAGQGWKLSDRPTVDIGVVEGDSNYQLARAGSPIRLSDGRIVVFNGATAQIRFYDTHGRFIKSVGRQGQGPGEFAGQGVGLFVLGRDSLLASDGRVARLSLFDGTGTFLRSAPIRPAGTRSASIAGVLPSGGLLALAGRAIGPGAPSGVFRDTAPYVRYGTDGIMKDSVGAFPSGEYYVASTPNSSSVTGRPFGLGGTVAVSHTGFYYGGGETYELRAYTEEGRLQRIIRLARPNAPLTPDAIGRFREERLRTATAQSRPFTERMLADVPFPKTLPAFAGIRVDEADNLWVLGSRLPGDSMPQWAVFDPTGAFLGEVQGPVNFRATHIGQDFILGLWHDPDEVQHVRMYQLIKPK